MDNLLELAEANLLRITFGLFAAASYFVPYAVEESSTLIGWPFRWLTLYEFRDSESLFSTSLVHLGYVAINLVFFYAVTYGITWSARKAYNYFFRYNKRH